MGVKNSSATFSVDSNWKKSKQPGGTFKLNKYDDKFTQVMYEIYENNPLRKVIATFLSNLEKDQILTINSSTENNQRWEITRKSNKTLVLMKYYLNYSNHLHFVSRFQNI